MTDTVTLLADLSDRGFVLSLDGTALVVTPAAKLTDADRVAIRQHRTALVELLTPGWPADMTAAFAALIEFNRGLEKR